MTTALLPEVAREVARSVQQVVEQRDPADAPVEDAEALIRVCRDLARELKRKRRGDRKRWDKGLAAAEARALLQVALVAFDAWSELAEKALAWVNRVAELRRRRVRGLDRLQDDADELDEERRRIGEMLEALTLRREWMAQMGLSVEEIDQWAASEEPPLSVEEERRNLETVPKLRAMTPSYAHLRALAERGAKRQGEG
jgi:hypothetical protein